MSFSGTFDPAKHPRLPKGQHGGGEFESGSGGTAGTGPAAPSPAAQPKAPVAPQVARARGVPKSSVKQAADDEQQEGQQTLGHKLLRVAAGSVDDIAVIALNGVVERHPDWFSALGHMFKSADNLINSGGDLIKFSPDQPRDEDGRWTAGGAAAVAASATAGGAASAFGASRLVQRGRRSAFEEAKTSLAGMRQARATNVARVLRHAGTVQEISRKLRNARTTFLPTALRTLRSQSRAADVRLRRHMAEHSEPFWIEPDADEPVWASTDAGGEALLRDDAERRAADLKALREKGRTPRTIQVTGSNHQPKVETFERTVRGPRKVRWRDRGAVERALADNREAFAEQGLQSVDDIEAMVLRIPARHLRNIMHQYGLPTPRIIRPHVVQTVRNAAKVIPSGKRVIEGYPDQDGRRKLAGAIRADLEQRSWDWLNREAPVAARRIANARGLSRIKGGNAAIRLSLLRQHGKAGVIGAGVLGAVAAGSAAYGWLRPKRVEKLAKAADASPPDTAQQVFDAGNDIEQTLAHKVAETFGRWSRLPGALLQNQSAGLHAILENSFGKALAPLGDAAQGGAQAEVPVVTQDETGRNRIVGMSLDTGSDKVRTFSQNYRVKLAGQIADEQMQTIQATLRDATLQGQAPATTARLLRQVIGLTPVQAGYVVSFRRGLQALDPNVLRRALRDARYDRTVQKAITTGTPLTEDQVNAMVDAYQRRALALRAMTIARTEGVGAANNGHALAVQEFVDDNPGYTVIKTWSSTHDERTRPDHVAMDGQQVVGLYTPFVAPSGDRIMWPHDPNAPLRQRVNCRCTFAVALVPRTAAAHRGFSLLADSPLEDADEAI